jgi:hypothetical protein
MILALMLLGAEEFCRNEAAMDWKIFAGTSFLNTPY